MKNSKENVRAYVDLEYCFPGMKRGAPRPTSKDLRQVVQIAAIQYDTETGEEIDHFERLTKPLFTDKVNSFFQELTGIAQDEIDLRAVAFPDALQDFEAFCGDYSIWTFDKYQEVLQQNCQFFNMELPFREDFVRVKSLLANWNVDAVAYSSGTLYKAARLDMDGHVHNALHDVRSMAAAVRFFESR